VTHPDGSIKEYGLVPAVPKSPAGDGKIDITGPNSPGREEHEWDVATPEITLDDKQYRDLMREIENSIANPPDYLLLDKLGLERFIPNWPGNEMNCTGWVVDTWNNAGLPSMFGVTDRWL
jgi:hypothetical protein